jgi:hypothetical protein
MQGWSSTQPVSSQISRFEPAQRRRPTRDVVADDERLPGVDLRRLSDLVGLEGDDGSLADRKLEVFAAVGVEAMPDVLCRTSSSRGHAANIRTLPGP